ncbi:MAG TPA: hypothetical protein VNG71_03980 [Pyrinomonadaceae bacterium]|nr:hypothetical protein [Pyrinomonadaceae bacterium]
MKGFSWVKGEHKEIGLDSFQSRILCEGHNRQLSPLDAEAQKLFETFEQIVHNLKANATVKPRNAYRKPKTWTVDGFKIERWAAKFLVGLLCAEQTDSQWYDNHSRAIEPPLWVVEAIFGSGQFEEPAGLYFATSYQADLASGLGIGPLSHPDGNEIVGADVSFGGFRFVIWLSRDSLKSFSIPPPTGVISTMDEADLKYRLELMQFPIRNVVNQRLVFQWRVPALQTTSLPTAVT